MRQGFSLSDTARGFASEYNVDVDSDMQQLHALIPVLVQLDGIGRPAVHITDASGADYYLSRIDYYDTNLEIHAHRAISMVMPGYRTKMAYSTRAAGKRALQVHRGAGFLIVGNSENNEAADSDFNTSIFPLDPEITPQVTVPPGRFYTIEAASWSAEPLVVSELSKTDSDGSWHNTEVAIEPGEEIIMTPDGMLEVPDEFLSARFD